MTNLITVVLTHFGAFVAGIVFSGVVIKQIKKMLKNILNKLDEPEQMD